MHNGAYLGMSLSPCHMTGGSGFNQMVREARRVINDGRALQLELSKLDQYATLARYGIRTPRTVAAVELLAGLGHRDRAGPTPTTRARDYEDATALFTSGRAAMICASDATSFSTSAPIRLARLEKYALHETTSARCKSSVPCGV